MECSSTRQTRRVHLWLLLVQSARIAVTHRCCVSSHRLICAILVIPRRLYSCRRGIERSVASLCMSVCPCSTRKTAGAIDTKLGRPIVRGSISACTEVSKGRRPRLRSLFYLTFALALWWVSTRCNVLQRGLTGVVSDVGLVGLHCDVIASSVPIAGVGSARRFDCQCSSNCSYFI